MNYNTLVYTKELDSNSLFLQWDALFPSLNNKKSLSFDTPLYDEKMLGENF